MTSMNCPTRSLTPKTSIDLKSKLLLFWLVLSSFYSHLHAQKSGQECFPTFDERRTVYDIAGILDETQSRAMESKLQEVAKTSSNEIAVVIVPSLCGMEKAQFATELGIAWKLGQAKEDNGIVVLIKPKMGAEKGEFFIAVGRGLEAVIPDATVYLIGQNEMIPAFKQGDMNSGINKALDILISLAKKEYDSAAYANRYKKGGKSPKSGFGFVGLIIGVVLLILLFKFRQVRRYSLVNDIPFWVAWSLFNSRSQHHGGFWNGFTGGGGGGGFNNDGGGFGGFGGGGDFGGGGAGGDW
jgi:uncharacterized protein